MTATHHHEVDAPTGTPTTGHEWDGIRELNTPLPRWWLWVFYATIVWSVAYWVVYPTWPLVSSFTGGVFGWHSRTAVTDQLVALKAQRGAMADKIAAAPLAEIEADPQMLAFARAQGKAAFADNCAPCHGAGGGGTKGYPNLNDDEWLWGGTLDQIHQTIEFGARAGNPEGHMGNMPAFGRDGLLQKPEILAVADYVHTLAGLPVGGKPDLAKGAEVFAQNCAACHGEQGKGNREVGAPDLTDAIWLYGNDKATIVETLTNGRAGVMPTWAGRLDEATIKALTVYVHSLGGGQ